jgi:hypothetical protein
MMSPLPSFAYEKLSIQRITALIDSHSAREQAESLSASTVALMVSGSSGRTSSVDEFAQQFL